ncbi:nuclear transport factor 2 family protein [Novosphingobium sp.]|uniref:nuclear transport factor 2 family protein n=1 Tax=Novosphingobium sp. TaxID=1874826 RepID=UPI0035AFB39A
MSFTLQQLSDLEEIRQLKSRYFRCIDTGNSAELATCFADDIVVDYRGGGYRLVVKGKDDMVEFLASSFHSDIVAMHHGHTPEITFVDADTAKGTWYLEDRFIDPVRGEDTYGTSLYYDTYVRTADGWKLKHSEYDRVIELVSPIDPKIQVRSSMLSQTGRKPGERTDTTKWLEWFD